MNPCIVERLRQPNASPMRLEAAEEIERLRKERDGWHKEAISLGQNLLDLEAATTPWRELQEMKRKIDALEPVAWRLYKDGELYAIKYEKEDRGSAYTWEPLYDLRGIKHD